jgi:hypothetical protein
VLDQLAPRCALHLVDARAVVVSQR